jgi:hypothetical protein
MQNRKLKKGPNLRMQCHQYPQSRRIHKGGQNCENDHIECSQGRQKECNGKRDR